MINENCTDVIPSSQQTTLPQKMIDYRRLEKRLESADEFSQHLTEARQFTAKDREQMATPQPYAIYDAQLYEF